MAMFARERTSEQGSNVVFGMVDQISGLSTVGSDVFNFTPVIRVIQRFSNLVLMATVFQS